MATKIRLARRGAKKAPFYHIVVADSRMPRDGRFIEKIGTYNPMLAKGSDNRVVVNDDRARHWLAVGAQPTDRVARFLAGRDLMKWTAPVGPAKVDADKAEASVDAAVPAEAAPAEEAAT